MTWRDTASPATRADLAAVLKVAMDIAEEAIARRGDLYPFGVAVPASDTGDIGLLAADLTGGDAPVSRSVVDLLRDGARADRDAHRAVALVSLVEVAGSDAIRVELEHAEGTAVVLVTPYVRGEETGALFYDGLTEVIVAPTIWGTSD